MLNYRVKRNPIDTLGIPSRPIATGSYTSNRPKRIDLYSITNIPLLKQILSKHSLVIHLLSALNPRTNFCQPQESSHTVFFADRECPPYRELRSANLNMNGRINLPQLHRIPRSIRVKVVLPHWIIIVCQPAIQLVGALLQGLRYVGGLAFGVTGEETTGL